MSKLKGYAYYFDRAKTFEEEGKWGLAADAWQRAVKLAPSGQIWKRDNNRMLHCRRKHNRQQREAS
ncbi:hypothetical protein [Aeromonas enteropelogenes]|uniref:hypothetical protein n=1 Tax=Aeromonas enteropelogenes TaxID=29489 RepID=UPI003B9FF0FC